MRKTDDHDAFESGLGVLVAGERCAGAECERGDLAAVVEGECGHWHASGVKWMLMRSEIGDLLIPCDEVAIQVSVFD